MTKLGCKRTTPKVSWLSKKQPPKRNGFGEKPPRRVSFLVTQKPLKRSKGLKPMSDKAKAENKVWQKIKQERMDKLREKFGYCKCEFQDCPFPDTSGEHFEWLTLEAHHNDHNRRHNFPSNCRITHRFCNQYISDHNIKDIPSLL